MVRLVSMAVERAGHAAAHVERAEAARRVAAELHAVDAGAARARIDIEIGAHIARHKARAPGLAEARIDTGEETAEPALQRGGIAVAISLAPAAETLRPEGETARPVIRTRCSFHREAIGIGRGVSQLRSAEAKRAQFAGNAGIRTLPHAAEHRAARELRRLALRVVHAAEHFARERIERLPRTVGGLVEHCDDERIRDRAAIEGRRGSILISRLPPRWQSRSRWWRRCHQFRYLCHRLSCRRRCRRYRPLDYCRRASGRHCCCHRRARG